MEFFKSSALSANEGVVEGREYVIYTDKNGTKTRIYNMDNPELCRRTGTIELELTKRGDARHAPRFVITQCYDSVNDIKIGIPIGNDPKTGELRFLPIVLEESHVFHLENKQDAMKWAVIKHHRDIDVDGSKTRSGQKSRYRVYDKEQEAQIFHNTRNIKRKAETIAEGLFGTQLRDFAIELGLDPDSMSVSQLSMEVIKKAEKEPKRFMDAWDSPTRHESTIVKKALGLGILTHDPMNGICYNSLPLGVSEPQAVQYLKDNYNTCNVIEKLIESKEAKFVEKIKKNVEPISDAKDAEIARLKAMLEAAEKGKAEISKVKLDEVVDKTIGNIIATDEEHAALVARAKDLKVQGWHIIKDKEILKKKIAEKEATIQN